MSVVPPQAPLLTWIWKELLGNRKGKKLGKPHWAQWKDHMLLYLERLSKDFFVQCGWKFIMRLHTPTGYLSNGLEEAWNLPRVVALLMKSCKGTRLYHKWHTQPLPIWYFIGAKEYFIWITGGKTLQNSQWYFLQKTAVDVSFRF